MVVWWFGCLVVWLFSDFGCLVILGRIAVIAIIAIIEVQTTKQPNN